MGESGSPQSKQKREMIGFLSSAVKKQLGSYVEVRDGLEPQTIQKLHKLLGCNKKIPSDFIEVLETEREKSHCGDLITVLCFKKCLKTFLNEKKRKKKDKIKKKKKKTS